MAMTQRERYLALGVGVVVSLFAANYGFTYVRENLQIKQDLVDAARKESDNMKRTATSGALAARKLEQLKTKSLPTSQETLVAQYKTWLTKLALDAGVTNIKVVPPEQPLKTTPAFKVYKFTLSGECTTAQWIDLLAAYYDADYLHTIHSHKATMTKVPGVVLISLDSHALALDVANPKQEPSGQSSGRLAMSADEYKQTILGRNPFSPPNQAPRVKLDREIELARGTPWSQIIGTDDAENHEVEFKLESESLPEGLSLSGKTLAWKPEENGSYEVLLTATDSGWPRATAQHKLQLKVVDPPAPKEPEPEPPKFDVATQAFITAVVNGRKGPEAWIFSRVEGRKVDLAEGSEFEIGSVKGKVVGINLNEDFVEIESDGVRWTMDMDTSLAEAFAKSKID